MSSNLRALETTYASRKFRSRLEARWACVFDNLRIHWEYEQNGFALPGGNYLPDFLLKGMGGVGDSERRVWFEVKPDDPNARATDPRWAELAVLSQIPVLVAFGLPRGDGASVAGDSRGEGFISLFDVDGSIDVYLAFAVCDRCGRVGITAEGRQDLVCDHAADERFEHARISRAFKIANGMRFDGSTRRGV